MDAKTLLADEERCWLELGDVFALVPSSRFQEPTVTPAGWSGKDVMFHIAAWMTDCALQLERIRAGTFDPAEETRETIERRNAEWFALSSTMDPRDVRVEFAAARQRMVEGFGALSEVTPAAHEWFEESGALHYLKHVADLREWLAGSTDAAPEVRSLRPDLD
jgi:hypothetical protein